MADDDDMPIVQPSTYHAPDTSMGDVDPTDMDQGHKKMSLQDQYKAFKPLMKVATSQGKDKAKAGLEILGEAVKDKLF